MGDGPLCPAQTCTMHSLAWLVPRARAPDSLTTPSIDQQHLLGTSTYLTHALKNDTAKRYIFTSSLSRSQLKLRTGCLHLILLKSPRATGHRPQGAGPLAQRSTTRLTPLPAGMELEQRGRPSSVSRGVGCGERSIQRPEIGPSMTGELTTQLPVTRNASSIAETQTASLESARARQETEDSALSTDKVHSTRRAIRSQFPRTGNCQTDG